MENLINKNVLNTDENYMLLNNDKVKQLYCEFMGILYLDLKYNFPDIDFQISGRIKSKVSNNRKRQLLKNEGKSEEIFDILGIKFIVNGKNNENYDITKEKEYRQIVEKMMSYLQSGKSILSTSLNYDVIQNRNRKYNKPNYHCLQMTMNKAYHNGYFNIPIEIHGRTKQGEKENEATHREYKEKRTKLKDLSDIDKQTFENMDYIKYSNLQDTVPNYYFVNYDGDVIECSDYVNLHTFYKDNSSSDNEFFMNINDLNLNSSCKVVLSGTSLKEKYAFYKTREYIDIIDKVLFLEMTHEPEEK